LRFLTLIPAIIIFIALLLFPSALPIQDLFFKKASYKKVGEIVFSPVQVDSSENVKQINVMFKTGDDALLTKVSSFSFRLIYPAENESKFLVVDSQGEKTDQINPNEILVNSSGWTVAVNKVKREEGRVVIDFAALYKGYPGFSASEYLSVASIYFEEGSLAKADLSKLSLDGSQTLMYTKEAPIRDIIKPNIKILNN
jgi:hypothetical protein